MSAEEKRPLPEGWTYAELDQFIRFVGSGITPRGGSSNYRESGIKFLRSQNVYPGELRLDNVAHVSEDLHQQMSRTHVEAGDVLLNITGASIGRAATVPGYLGPANVNQHVCILRTDNSVFPNYLSWYLNSPDGQDQIMNTQSGVTRQGLNFGQIRSMTMPIAPIQEQKYIVAEIDKQFTRLRQAVASLKRAQANLQRYKASVLKAACDGRLVPQDPNDETAEKLLQRILAERRRQWQEQEWAKLIQKAQKKVAQSRRKAQGLPARLSDLEPEEWQEIPEAEYARYLPKNDKWKEKYKEPEPVDTADLPPLPEGWVWATAEQLSDETRAITYGVVKLGDVVDSGVPTLRSSNVRHLSLDLKYVKHISPEIAGIYSRTFLQGGEVLVTVRGTLGGVVYVPDECNGYNISREVAMIALVDKRVGPILQSFIGSKTLQDWLSQRTRGIAYTGINIETLKQLPIPLPALNEQERIVEEVEQRLSVIAANEKAIAADLARAERLRQSILQQAFSGLLVPQLK